MSVCIDDVRKYLTEEQLDEVQQRGVKRSRVMDAVNSQLKHTLDAAKHWKHDNTPTVGEEILIMEAIMLQARTAYAKNGDDTDALTQIRALVASGHRCMMNHGAPLFK